MLLVSFCMLNVFFIISFSFVWKDLNCVPIVDSKFTLNFITLKSWMMMMIESGNWSQRFNCKHHMFWIYNNRSNANRKNKKKGIEKKSTQAWSIISRAGYRGIKHTNDRVRLSVCIGIFIINGIKTNRYDKFILILTVHVQCTV